MIEMEFLNTGLEPRLLRALAKQGLSKPTPVQAACIPKALEGKDILARARTGSGKTLAYLLPTLHKLLASGDPKAGWRALVLVPTRELCEQVCAEARAVTRHCGTPLLPTSLAADAPAAQRAAASGAGALVVATPGRVAAALRSGWLLPSLLSQRLEVLVLDEADLLLSYGYEEDLRTLAPQVPRSCQCMLMSATSGAALEALQALILHNPVTLNLLTGSGGADGGGDGAAAGGGLGAGGAGAASEIRHVTQHCAKADRMLVTMALLKLGLVRKKVLIFVNSSDAGLRLRLFLESFGLRCGLLSADTPVNVRSHALASFNKGLFDYLIAIDDVHAAAQGGDGGVSGAKQRKRKAAQLEEQGSKRQRGRPAKDEEFGVTRGIDFKGVRSVVNFDLPSSVQGYVHRVGRTGRAGQAGLALSLVTPDDAVFESELAAALAPGGSGGEPADGGDSDSSSDSDDEGAAARRQARGGLAPFGRLTKAAVEALRYRGEDMARSLTKSKLRDARAQELKQALLNSQKLSSYFESHEHEKALLKHDKPLHKTPVAPHLKHLPAYLRAASLPATQRDRAGTGGAGAASGRRGAKAARPGRGGGAGGASAAPADPLRALSSGGSGGGFMRAPKKGRGAWQHEELTEMEVHAMQNPARPKRKEPMAPLPKRNVRRRR